jgi:multidrug efflux pump subunit AcrA (membrane-fusion protein)
MPQQKKYTTAAERQAAYRARQQAQQEEQEELSTADRIAALEGRRADLAAQLESARAAVEQTLHTGADILAAQQHATAIENAITAVDGALDQARETLAQEEAAQQRAAAIDRLQHLAQERAGLYEQQQRVARGLHDALAEYVPQLRQMRGQHKQIYDETTALLRQCGGHFKHYMQMRDPQEAADAALLDELAALGIDLDTLLAAPDHHSNWHHHATRDSDMGPLLPKDAPFRAEVARLAYPGLVPAPAPAQQQPDTRTSPLEPRGGPVGEYFRKRYGGGNDAA